MMKLFNMQQEYQELMLNMSKEVGRQTEETNLTQQSSTQAKTPQGVDICNWLQYQYQRLLPFLQRFG